MNVRSSSVLTASLLACVLTSGALAQVPSTGDSLLIVKPWGRPDTTSYLPDSTVLARIEDRVIRAGEFTYTYYSTNPEFRPSDDSTGRASFLNTMINKEIMGRVAKASGLALSFEDRLKMREHTQRVLSNAVYQRMALDSIFVTNAEVEHVLGQYARDLHLREILFDERAVAERSRAEILAKRATWEQVAKAHRLPKDAKGPDGDIGWITRARFDPGLGITVFDLKVGEISPVIADPQGLHLFQVVEEKPARVPTSELFKRSIGSQIRDVKARAGVERVKRIVGRGSEMVFDTTNLRWASSRFRATRTITQAGGTPNVEFDVSAPDISPQDTGRVLVRYRGGQITLGGFLHHYTEIPGVLRPSVNSPDLMRSHLEGLIVEPLAAQEAVRRGFDKDPAVVAQLDVRRDQLLVDAIYRDSIEARVYISAQERRAYYDKNMHRYQTWPEVTFAAFFAPTQAGADSLVARLRAGEKPEDILLADSLAGVRRGSIQTRRMDAGGPYQKILFEELRPGEATVVRPDPQGNRAILYLIHHELARQMSFEEADRYINESLSNAETEKRLDAFLARHRRDFAIATHPDRLMKIRFAAPELF
jgi:peptidyl-prolyl cis-trans isomerase C